MSTISSVADGKFNIHKILTFPVLLMFSVGIVVLLVGARLHIPFDVGTLERNTEEMLSTSNKWFEFKLQTSFTKMVQIKFLMCFIFQ